MSTSTLPPDHITQAGVHGFGGEDILQAPKGRIFTNGLLSPIFALLESRSTIVRVGSTLKVDFATPIVQLIFAPSTTYDVPMQAPISVMPIQTN